MRRVHEAVYATHPFYACWYNMIQRCYNPDSASYSHYGARGIKVCESWLEFDGFYEDMFSSWSKGLEIDRIDNNSGYWPDNCRWATRSQNCQNTRSTKLSHEEVAYIRSMRGHKTNKALGAEFGVSASHICRIQNFEKWRA